MSDILNHYFCNKTNNFIKNSSTKYLKENKDKNKLINCGLYLSESNILTIPRKLNSINKLNISKSHKNLYLLFHNNSKLINQKKMKSKISQKYNNKVNFNKKYSTKSNSNDITKKKNGGYNKKNMYCNIEINKKEKSKIYPYLDKNNNKVEEIINSLMNDNKDNKKIIYSYLSKNFSEIIKSKKYYKKENYPQEKIISPKNYIEYNLKTKPYNTNSFKSFDVQIKFFKNKEYINKKILERIDKFNKNEIKEANLNIKPYYDNNLRNVKNILFDNKNNFHFKTCNNDNFKDNNRNRKRYKYKIFNGMEFKGKNLNSFDEEMNNILISNKNGIKYINNLSERNEHIFNGIKKLYKKLYL